MLTPQQHVARVRQVMLQLERADRGLGMPRDYQLVLRLRSHLEQVTNEAMTAICEAFVHSLLPLRDAVQMLEDMGEEEAERVVNEWADLAQAEKDRRDGRVDYSDQQDI